MHDRRIPLSARSEGKSWSEPGSWSSADRDRGEAAQVADREVDLAEQEHEDDAEGEHAVPASWMMMLMKLLAVKKFVALKLKKTMMSDQAEDDRQDAEVAGS